MRPMLLVLLCLACARADEAPPATVLTVLSGNSLLVSARVGDQEMPVVLRLGWLRAPEGDGDGHRYAQSAKYARAMLETLAPPGTVLRFTGTAQRLAVDDHGRTRALFHAGGAAASVQELMVACGAGVYDDAVLPAPGEAHGALRAAQAKAQAASLGGWGKIGEWMTAGEMPPHSLAAQSRTRPVTKQPVIRRDGIAGMAADQLAWGKDWICPECDEHMPVGEMVCEDCGYIISETEMRRWWLAAP